jgi:magnesium transporter
MLVNCVVYQDGKRVADIGKDEIAEYINRLDCFVWIGLFEPSIAELQEMQQEFKLHELAVEDASHGHQRPKIEEYGNSLFVVLQTVELKGEDLEVGEVEIFVGSNYIVSVRMHSEHGFRSVRARCESEPHLLKHGAAFVLYALMDAVVDRYFPVLDALESRLEEIEERIFKRNTARSNIEALYQLKQKLMVLKHAVEPLREATGRLTGGRVPQLCAGMREYFRDVFDHLHRIDMTIEGIRDMQSSAIQVNLGMINLSETEVTKKLAAWAAIIAVPTLIAGIYGMNFKGMPEYELPYAYPVCIAVMLALDSGLFLWFKKIKWL